MQHCPESVALFPEKVVQFPEKVPLIVGRRIVGLFPETVALFLEKVQLVVGAVLLLVETVLHSGRRRWLS